MASYEEALALVKRKGGIKLTELADELGIPWGTALKFLELMERQSVILPANTMGFRAIVSNFESNRAGTSFGDQGKRSQDRPLTDRQRAIELEETIVRLKESGRTVIAQREEWKSRALAAEAKIASHFSVSTNRDGRYATLKRILARELHPDYAPSDSLDRVLREALFKRIWPMIEELDNGQG